MHKRLIFLLILMTSINANAAAAIESPDFGDGDWRMVVLSVGFLASLACHVNKDLIRWGKVTTSLEVICRWSFRIAIFLLVLPLVGRVTGFLQTMDASNGWRVLALWSVLRAMQALYVSGVSFGVRESSFILKKLDAPRSFD